MKKVLQLLLGLANIGWVPDLMGKFLCVLLDYLLPFTMLGAAGLFRNLRIFKNERTNAMVTALIGTLMKNYEKKWDFNADFQYSGGIWNWLILERKL